jgi:hypothetical protein
VTGGKPIAVLLQTLLGGSAINPLVAFYDIHGGKREVLFFYFVPDTTRDTLRYVMMEMALTLKSTLGIKYNDGIASMLMTSLCTEASFK